MTDATLSHNMLVVTHSSGLVRLYSFQAISEQVKDREQNQCSAVDAEIVLE